LINQWLSLDNDFSKVSTLTIDAESAILSTVALHNFDNKEIGTV